jgi:hypothetical protein
MLTQSYTGWLLRGMRDRLWNLKVTYASLQVADPELLRGGADYYRNHSY